MHVVTTDESWFWTWELDSKQGSSQWIAPGEVRPTKPCKEQSTVKSMLIAFFNKFGMVHHEWVPQGRGVDRHLYLAALTWMRDAFWRKRPQIWQAGNWALLQDNAPAHKADLVLNWLRNHHIETLPHPGYSLDLSPPDYWLFAQLKKMTHGIRYQTKEDLICAVNGAIDSIPEAEYCLAMDQYPERLQKCIAAQGEYFECD